MIDDLATELYNCSGPAERHALRNVFYRLKQRGEIVVTSDHGRLVWTK